MIKKIICQFGTILTFVWAVKILFTIGIINKIEQAVLINDLLKIGVVIGLIAAGFWLMRHCSDDKCKAD